MKDSVYRVRSSGRFVGAAVALTVLFGAVFSGQASAYSILLYEDLNVGASVTGGALALLGLSATTAADTADFATLLGSQSWDLVIFGEQNVHSFDDVSAELTGYVAGGGRLLGTSWLDGGYIGLMDAVLVEQNAALIIPDGHPLFAGIGGPIALTNPGWSVFSQSYDPVAPAQGIGTLGIASAAVLGNGGRTLLYGPLFDTYAVPAEGERFVANGIDLLLADVSRPIPEPASIALLGIGVGGMALRRMRRKNA